MAPSEFPRDEDQYVLIATIGTAEAATMHQANYVSPMTGCEFPVGIKVFQYDEIKDLYFVLSEVQQAKTFDHENLVNVHCSFKIENLSHLWVITPPLPGYSLRSMIRSSFRRGLPEDSVSFILKEILKALNHMHGKNIMHRYIGADCIFLCEEEYSSGEYSSVVKLALRSLSYYPNNETSAVGYPDWTIALDFRTDGGELNVSKEIDVRMFGLLALELFYGRIPASNLKGFRKLIENKMIPVGSGFLGKFWKRRKMPEPLREMVAACLSDEPEKRPTTDQLMEFELFKKDFAGRQILAKLNNGCKLKL